MQVLEERSDAACRVVVKTKGSWRKACGGFRGGMVYVYCDGRGNLRVAKTPPLQSGVCGDIVAGDCRTDHHLRPCGHLREGGKANHDAARRVATSFEKRGESVLNRRIPKGKPRQKTRMGSIFYWLWGLRVKWFKPGNSGSRRT